MPKVLVLSTAELFEHVTTTRGTSTHQTLTSALKIWKATGQAIATQMIERQRGVKIGTFGTFAFARSPKDKPVFVLSEDFIHAHQLRRHHVTSPQPARGDQVIVPLGLVQLARDTRVGRSLVKDTLDRVQFALGQALRQGAQVRLTVAPVGTLECTRDRIRFKFSKTFLDQLVDETPEIQMPVYKGRSRKMAAVKKCRPGETQSPEQASNQDSNTHSTDGSLTHPSYKGRTSKKAPVREKCTNSLFFKETLSLGGNQSPEQASNQDSYTHSTVGSLTHASGSCFSTSRSASIDRHGSENLDSVSLNSQTQPTACTPWGPKSIIDQIKIKLLKKGGMNSLNVLVRLFSALVPAERTHGLTSEEIKSAFGDYGLDLSHRELRQLFHYFHQTIDDPTQKMTCGRIDLEEFIEALQGPTVGKGRLEHMQHVFHQLSHPAHDGVVAVAKLCREIDLTEYPDVRSGFQSLARAQGEFRHHWTHPVQENNNGLHVTENEFIAYFKVRNVAPIDHPWFSDTRQCSRISVP